MLDVHPPHESAHTWTDFFIHIATIGVGLLIAIGLEQAVEAIHHHHQREFLEEQMHQEAQRNLDLVRYQIPFASARALYFDRCVQALSAARPDAGKLIATLPADNDNLPQGLLISPSQATWAVARAAGTVALLPPEEAKIFTRLDLVEDFEQHAEASTGPAIAHLTSVRFRDHLPVGVTTPVALTPEQRDDLVFTFSQSHEVLSDLKFRLVILEGDLEAIIARVPTLEDMYPYQTRALQRESAAGPSNRSTEPFAKP